MVMVHAGSGSSAFCLFGVFGDHGSDFRLVAWAVVEICVCTVLWRLMN